MQVPTPTPPLEPTPNGDPQGLTPTPNGQTPNGPPHKTPIDSLPPDVQDYIKSLRSEAEKANDLAKAKVREQAAQAKEREQAAQAELDKQLVEQGKFKELAEAHATKVRELEPIASKYTQLSELLTEQIKATIKNWPDEVKSLVPGKDTPIELRLEQVGKLQALADRLAQQAQGQQPGNRPNPKPAQNMTPDEVSQKALEELRSRSPGKYSL